MNDPSVLGAVAPGYADVSLAHFFDDPRNVAFGDADGFVLFAALGAGRYDMHYLFTARRRGKAALQQVREGVKLLFTEHSATAICGETPRENRAARTASRAIGGRPVGVSTDTHGRPCIKYMLDRATWATLLAASSGALAP